MENKEIVIFAIGYFLAIFLSPFGLIYGIILYLLKKDKEVYYDHSRNIIAVAIILIAVNLFVRLGSLLF